MWVDRAKKLSGLDNNQILLVGNKADLEESRIISYDAGFEFAKAVGISYIETSAKTGDNVEIAFVQMINDAVVREINK